MKLKDKLVLRQVAGTWVVLPMGKDVINFDGMLNLNDTGVMLWKKLETGAEKQELVDALTAEYDVSEEQASADIEEFIEKLFKAGCLQE